MTDAARPVTPALTMETALAKIAADADHDRNGDAENWHAAADGVLVDFLRALGHDIAMDLYESIPKWYS